MTKILVVSDDGVSSGFGRISMEVNRRLHQRGYQIMAASLYYDGLLPPTLDGQALPYWIASLQGKDWVQSVLNIINAYQPDIIHCCQDAPYAQTLRNAPVDWSRYRLVVTTPVDGTPLHPEWVVALKAAAGVLSISAFGVQAHRDAGISSELCLPGVDVNAFFPLADAPRAELRDRLGIARDAFVLGTMCMNQGRKDIPDMLRAFFAFAADKPTARYLLDMDAVSPAGWDIPALCQQFGWDVSKLLFRIDAQRRGVVRLNERYNLLDAHTVISHREGWGLPLVEAMACGVVSIALDWTSGTEICGGGKGILIEPIEYTSIGTWGGALDKFPNVGDLTRALQMLSDNPDERRAIAKRGMAWARGQSWDAAADAVQRVYDRAMKSTVAPAIQPPPLTPELGDFLLRASAQAGSPQSVVSPDGVQHETVALVEG